MKNGTSHAEKWWLRIKMMTNTKNDNEEWKYDNDNNDPGSMWRLVQVMRKDNEKQIKTMKSIKMKWK